MNLRSIAVLSLFGIITNLFDHKVDAAENYLPPFVTNVTASYQDANFRQKYHSNRFVVAIKGDAKHIVMAQAVKMETIINGEKYDVIEFDDNNAADIFKKESMGKKIYYEEDPRIFPYVGEVNGEHNNVRRKLEDYIPWGIKNVFTREDGSIDIPGPDYFPSEEIHKVCIIDSGYQDSHLDLVTTAQNADPSQNSTFNIDLCKHGTHVAGTILATDNDVGVIGVFPGASAQIVKVFSGANCSYSYVSSLVRAAQHCRDAGAKIISMSLGGSSATNFEYNAFKELYENDGILSIAAAGNRGTCEFSYPASYDHVMSVGATDINDKIASFSQFNSQVDISGPGVGVISTTGTNGYSDYSGTSMATPHVSAVALLLWNKYPNCTNIEIRNALEAGAKDEGPSGRDDYYGHGVVRYWNSVAYLEAKPCGTTSSPTTSPQPSAPPTQWACNGVSFELEILADNYGYETSWTLEHNATEVASNNCHASNTLYKRKVCLDVAGSYNFTIFDSFGDGICCQFGQGSYRVNVCGNVTSGGSFGRSESFVFEVDPSLTCPSGKPSSSIYPSSSPSKNPTTYPTSSMDPTAAPSSTTLPTLDPTMIPSHTLNPSTPPTLSTYPTKNPTYNPTSFPSSRPSPNPSSSPTKSLFPTLNPTIFPTKFSSSFPTMTPSPTKLPTTLPTIYPTSLPTEFPTSYPTKYPSFSPTKSPTKLPTTLPTIYPSSLPTNFPTYNPTMYPSSSPTKSPTFLPTTLPTIYPTSLPTNFPTPRPSTYPSLSPTKFPTLHPTKNPSSSPTKSPTFQPTTLPTSLPTINPTINPSSRPTTLPTKVPSQHPTAVPSIDEFVGLTIQPCNNYNSKRNQCTKRAYCEWNDGDRQCRERTEKPSSVPSTIAAIPINDGCAKHHSKKSQCLKRAHCRWNVSTKKCRNKISSATRTTTSPITMNNTSNNSVQCFKNKNIDTCNNADDCCRWTGNRCQNRNRCKSCQKFHRKQLKCLKLKHCKWNANKRRCKDNFETEVL